MASLHKPSNTVHHHILRFDDGAAPGGVPSSASGQFDWSPSWRAYPHGPGARLGRRTRAWGMLID